MSESVPLSRLRPIGAFPSSRIPTTSSLIRSSSFPFRGPRNHSSPSLIAVSSSGSKFPIFNVVKNGQGSIQELDDNPLSIELLPICSETQFDLVIAEAKQPHQGAIVVWMANWCIKCIYLKPKLERLAADYHPSLRFYCVDVNNVPHKLVARAGVTMVTLWKEYWTTDNIEQASKFLGLMFLSSWLWGFTLRVLICSLFYFSCVSSTLQTLYRKCQQYSYGEMDQGEVIGGHKAYQVINEVREMIETNIEGDI